MEAAAQSIPICQGVHWGHGGSQEGPWVLQEFTALKNEPSPIAGAPAVKNWVLEGFQDKGVG